LTTGVYVVIPSVIAAMTGGAASAWLFLTRITACGAGCPAVAPSSRRLRAELDRRPPPFESPNP
jgi:hypothetical protein